MPKRLGGVVVDVGSLFIGAGEVGAAGKVAEAGKATEAVKALKGTKALDAGKAIETSNFVLNEFGPTQIVARDAVDLAAQRRLNKLDGDIGNSRPGEAVVAAEMKITLVQDFPGLQAAQMQISSLNQENVLALAWIVKLTPDSLAVANKLNAHIDKTSPKFFDSVANKLAHADGVEMMPFDTRILTTENAKKLFDFIETLPISSQGKVIYLVD